MQPSGYEEVRHNDELIAIIIRAHFTSDSTIFFTPPNFSQQLGYIVHKKNGIIKAHIHKEMHRIANFTQEVLFIKNGSMMVNFYTTNKKYITSKKLVAGDIIFLCKGGHGFKMLEDTEIVEVKQGPYFGKGSDKEVFEA
jgi:hypothetical protein